MDGILVAPGFGARGTEGKIDAVRYAREQKVPFFGICLGMQMAVIEFARNVVRPRAAPTRPRSIRRRRYPVVDLMPDQRERHRQGRRRCASARIPACSAPGTRAADAYGATEISERHRHRYEVNNDYREALDQHGMVISGASPDRRLVEMIELPQHPYFVGCQFHPEFKSRPQAPHPLFQSFIARGPAAPASGDRRRRQADGRRRRPADT